MTANQRWLPSAAPPIRQDPGEFLVETIEKALPGAIHNRIPEVVKNGTAKLLAIEYGLTFGMLYAACRPDGGALFRASWQLNISGGSRPLVCCHLSGSRNPGRLRLWLVRMSYTESPRLRL